MRGTRVRRAVQSIRFGIVDSMVSATDHRSKEHALADALRRRLTNLRGGHRQRWRATGSKQGEEE
jgi:hypothetical protein